MRLKSMFLLSACLYPVCHSVEAQTLQSSAVEAEVLSQQLQPYQQVSDAQTCYQASKAQIWLSYAKNEFSERSLTTAGMEALAQGRQIAEKLAQKKPLSLTTPILTVSQVMRRDLWWQVEYFKQSGALEKAPEQLAHAEVMLVWAAAEYCELGWRHAREHFDAAEQALYQVAVATRQDHIDTVKWDGQALPSLKQLNGPGCQGGNSDYWPLKVSAPIQDQTSKPALTEPDPKIENVVHFAVDRADLNAEAKAVLDHLSTFLLESPDIQMTLVGYTDPRASQAYNLQLSQRRIDAVREYLIAQGVQQSRMSEQAKGKLALIQDVEQKIAHAKSRRVVIQFDNEVHVQPQWQDLQLEP
ncbi:MULTISPECIES: OmpA family protein [unclassified Acinetobacter]|uniref:OmpA family protein n=1 Tax=unclassified Acinetobacter TaxID=196816 RepID=UPI000A35552D|nr:OmpA family protein [Acinetobacter sp. ANC 4218]OTG70346.1 hypothetical protein B9T38_12490 [Acinetobacter sp. ANC 4218]